MPASLCNSGDWANCEAGYYPGLIKPACCLECPDNTVTGKVGDYSSAEDCLCKKGYYQSLDTVVDGVDYDVYCTPCPIDTYNPVEGSTSVSDCTDCPSGMFTLGETAVTSSSGCKSPATCEKRGNGWHIVNNTDDLLCGPYSYSSEQACKNAIESRMISPTYTQCETPMKNTPNTILPGAYVGIIAQAACAGTTAATCKPPTNVRYERTRWAPELEAGVGGVMKEGNVELGCGESNGTSTGTCFDFSALLPSMYIAGQGNPLPIFHDDDGNLNYSGKFVENGTNDWNLENLADGSKTGILWTQGCRNCTNSDPTWTKQIFTDDEDGFNAAATAAATTSGTTAATSPLYWPWNDANLDTSQKEDGHFAYYTGENCSAGVNCHGWYKDPLYYGSPNRGSGYNLDGLWGNAMVAYDKDSDSGYLTPSQACSSHCK